MLCSKHLYTPDNRIGAYSHTDSLHFKTPIEGPAVMAVGAHNMH